MDKKEAIQIQDAVRDAVSDVLVKHSLLITKNSARFTPTSIRITLELDVTDTQGVNQAAKADWERYASSFGLPVEAFGQTFVTYSHEEFRIVGLEPKRRRFPVSAERVGTGKRYKFPAGDVANYLQRQHR